MSKRKSVLILYGATDFGMPNFSADILWRTGGFNVPDPVFLIEIKGRAYLFVHALEVGRARKEARVSEVVRLRKGDDIVQFLRAKHITHLTVPHDFPYAWGKAFEHNFRVVSVASGEPIYPEREIKTRAELREVSKAQRAVERAVRKAMLFLRRCVIQGNRIIAPGKHLHQKRVVTSEMVREIIDGDLYRQGFLGIRSIVAGGRQAADPHCEGSGPLRPHVPIVMDVFPCSIKTHYWADMTRTVFKGEPSEQFRLRYDTVLQAQIRAIGKVRDGVNGQDIQHDTEVFFDSNGFRTDNAAKPPRGFFHSVGHGVGVDIHEFPRIGSSPYTLRAGSVVTVEPGLYYPEWGGIRIEDMVVVTKKGRRNLTRFPKRFKDIVIP